MAKPDNDIIISFFDRIQAYTEKEAFPLKYSTLSKSYRRDDVNGHFPIQVGEYVVSFSKYSSFMGITINYIQIDADYDLIEKLFWLFRDEFVKREASEELKIKNNLRANMGLIDKEFVQILPEELKENTLTNLTLVDRFLKWIKN